MWLLSLLDSSYERAILWHDIADWILVLALVVGVVATYISIKTGNTKEEYLKRELAESNDRIARLNNETERLKADNLALQAVMQPRRLGSLIAITSPDEPDVPPLAEIQFEGIKAFKGTPVLIQTVPDFEAGILARDMRAVLAAFGWRPQFIDEGHSHLPVTSMFPGVGVTFPANSKYVQAAFALAEGFSKAGLAGTHPGMRGGKVFAQGFPEQRVPGMFPYFDPPVDAVIVFVGMKPMNVSSPRQ